MPTYSRTSQCKGKMPYVSRRTAALAIKKAAGQKPYHCQICGQWHTGHKPKDRTKG